MSLLNGVACFFELCDIDDRNEKTIAPYSLPLDLKGCQIYLCLDLKKNLKLHVYI